MELMPHIKALLNDLIQMTDHIVVKRTDLANRYENNNNTLHLYQQSVEILDGVSTFYTYPKYFKSVLRQYSKWVKQDSDEGFGALEPLVNSNNKYNTMLSSGNMTMSKQPPSGKENIGNGWVKYIGNGSFPVLYNFESVGKNITTSIVGLTNGELDINKNIASMIFDGPTMEFLKNRILYIHDSEFDAYVPVSVQFTSEYVTIANHVKDDSFTYLKDGSGNNLIFVNNY